MKICHIPAMLEDNTLERAWDKYVIDGLGLVEVLVNNDGNYEIPIIKMNDDLDLEKLSIPQLR